MSEFTFDAYDGNDQAREVGRRLSAEIATLRAQVEALTTSLDINRSDMADCMANNWELQATVDALTKERDEISRQLDLTITQRDFFGEKADNAEQRVASLTETVGKLVTALDDMACDSHSYESEGQARDKARAAIKEAKKALNP